MNEIAKAVNSALANEPAMTGPLALPEVGFVRIDHIVGNPKKGILGVFPVSKSSWWEGVRRGIYPPAYKIGLRAVGWKIEDIRALIKETGNQCGEG